LSLVAMIVELFCIAMGCNGEAEQTGVILLFVCRFTFT
jgi:hypothetical protein